MTLWEIVLLIYGIGFASTFIIFTLMIGITDLWDFFVALLLSSIWILFIPSVPFMIISIVSILILAYEKEKFNRNGVSLKDIEDMKD